MGASASSGHGRNSGEKPSPILNPTLQPFMKEQALFAFDGSTGSVTISGTVSPAGGNFEEPLPGGPQGCRPGLSRERSDARKYPAIDPLESWSKYRRLR